MITEPDKLYDSENTNQTPYWHYTMNTLTENQVRVHLSNCYCAPENGYSFSIASKFLFVQELESFYVGQEPPPDPYWIRDEQGVRRREVPIYPLWAPSPAFVGSPQEAERFIAENPYRPDGTKSYERFSTLPDRVREALNLGDEAYAVEAYVQRDFSYPFDDTYRGTIICSSRKFTFRYAEGAVGPISDAEAYEDGTILYERRMAEKAFFESVADSIHFQRLESSYPSGGHSGPFQH